MPDIHSLLALSPLDGRYSESVQDLQTSMSEFGLIRYRVIIEVSWLQTLCQLPQIATTPLDASEQQHLATLLDNFSLKDAEQIKMLEKTTNHDVKAVEYFLQQSCREHPTLQHRIPLIHFAATSEDINNLAYGLMLKDGRHLINQHIQALLNTLRSLSQQHAHLPMLSRTHGQAASPSTIGKELINFVMRLRREQHRLMHCELLGTFNGAVGNYNAHTIAYPEINWPDVSQRFVESLGLNFNPITTQIEPHDALAELLDHLARFNTILIDLNRDLWSYISRDHFILEKKANEVGSSTMPHKINPIDFENSEGNLGVANALAGHLARQLPISRLQRDLSDSTRLRNLGSVFGYSLVAYKACLRGLKKLSPHKAVLAAELDNHWEVLGEAVQTVLRRYGVTDAYERVKTLTRGKALSQQHLIDWLQQQPIPQPAKDTLAALTPADYTGLAAQLTEKYLDD